MPARIGAQTDRLPPLPWKYSTRARGAGGSIDQPRRRSPSLVSTDHDAIWRPGSAGDGVSPLLGKNANRGSTRRTTAASATISTTRTTTILIKSSHHYSNRCHAGRVDVTTLRLKELRDA